jgi:hypothetical protein
MRFVAWLSLGVLLAVFGVAINLVPALRQTGVTQTVVRGVIVALIRFGL